MSTIIRLQEELRQRELEQRDDFSKSSPMTKYSNALLLLLLVSLTIAFGFATNSGGGPGFSFPTFVDISLLCAQFICWTLWFFLKSSITGKSSLRRASRIHIAKIFIASILISYSTVVLFLLFFPRTPGFSADQSILQNGFWILVVSFLLLLTADIRKLSSKKGANQEFFTRFFYKQLDRWDPNRENGLGNTLAFLGIIVIFPTFIMSFLLPGISISIVIWLIILSMMFTGYWAGYGLFRTLLWFQGYDPDAKIPLIGQVGGKLIASILANLTIFLSIVAALALVLLSSTGLELVPGIMEFIIPITIFFLFLALLVKTNPQKSGMLSHSSPTLSVLQIISIVLFMLPILYISSSPNLPQWLRALFDSNPIIFPLLQFGIIFNIVLIYFSYYYHVTRTLWHDTSEINKVLSELQLDFRSLSPAQLHLLAKIGLSQKDSNTLIKIMGLIQLGFDRKATGFRFLHGITVFLKYHLTSATDWKVHALVFSLIDQLLVIDPGKHKEFIDGAFIGAERKEEVLRHASLDLLGHIVHISPSLANEVFPIALKIYESSSSEYKKNLISPLRFYAKNFPEYREKLLNFILNHVEKEFFGLATELMTILDEISSGDTDYKQKIMKTCEAILQTPESKAALGATRFIVRNFPKTPEEGVPLLKLLVNSLRTALPEVRQHAVYEIGSLMKRIPELVGLLPEIEFIMEDEEPNARAAFVQIIADLYAPGSTPETTVASVLRVGILDDDYVVRLTTMSSLAKLLKTDEIFLKYLKEVLVPALNDPNTDVKDSGLHLYQQYFNFLETNHPDFVKTIGIIV